VGAKSDACVGAPDHQQFMGASMLESYAIRPTPKL
jgi:hypothetical protein